MPSKKNKKDKKPAGDGEVAEVEDKLADVAIDDANSTAEPETNETTNKVPDVSKDGSSGTGNAESAEPNDDGDDNNEDGIEDGEGADKKKDKKKRVKKDKKEKEAPKAKGPGAKLKAAMQERLKLLKEEEERLQREEEERIQREDEAENARLEKLRLDKEKKDRKKLKEKERIERLKKEGKFLTAKQKAEKQRAQASLELLKQQGVVIGKVSKSKVSKQDIDNIAEDDKSAAEKSKSLAEDNGEDVSADVDESDDAGDDENNIVDDWEDLGKPEVIETSAPVKHPAADANKKAPVPTEKSVEVNDFESAVDSKVLPPPTLVLRSPIICVLGHVDTGKTKLLDYLRKTHVQDNEAGGITQQIGATYVPPSAIHDQRKGVKNVVELKMPGLLIIDTPGHESFTNLRSRGSSLCDIAILVIDIMHGLEPQTIESINLLKSRKTPFVVALNKIDRLYEFKGNRNRDVEDVINSQPINTKLEFEKRTNEVIGQLNTESLNAALYYKNTDVREYVSLVPTSAHSGDGMGNLINLLVSFSQNFLHKKLTFDPIRLECTVLEVKALPGLGTTVDVILVNGKLNEGDKIVLAGHDGPIVTHIRSLLVPQPLRELRVKSPYQELKCVYGAMGIKITGQDLEKTVAGLELSVAKSEAEIEHLKAECARRFGDAMRAIKCVDRGVHVQASTLGSLEALLQFLKDSKIPYASVRIGPVVKRDVMKASTMLESAPDYAVILAFDVKVEKDADDMAKKEGVQIFTAEIIYHLFDKFTAYHDDLKQKKKDQYKGVAVFPCKLRILPQFIFNTRDPIVLGVSIEEGSLRPGTPIAVPTKDNVEIGRVSSIEINHKIVDSATRGQEVCVKIDHVGGDAPKLYGRHFDHTDLLVSRITRESIDAVKEYYRDEMTKNDWQLMIELKKSFEIV